MSAGQYTVAPNALQEVRARIAARYVQENAGRVWANISHGVRVAVVMCSLDTGTQDPREVARMPWGSFTADQQLAIGACAREFVRQLQGADALR